MVATRRYREGGWVVLCVVATVLVNLLMAPTPRSLGASVRPPVDENVPAAASWRQSGDLLPLLPEDGLGDPDHPWHDLHLASELHHLEDLLVAAGGVETLRVTVGGVVVAGGGFQGDGSRLTNLPRTGCWDLDRDGVADPAEDRDGSGIVDELDCLVGLLGGQPADRIVAHAAAPDADCGSGGHRFVAVDAAGGERLVAKVCHGATGPDGMTGAQGAAGDEGPEGIPLLLRGHPEGPTSLCTNGGRRIILGHDGGGHGALPRDGVLSESEVEENFLLCHGNPGDVGPPGPEGPLGPAGPAGAQGPAGPMGEAASILLTGESALPADCPEGGRLLHVGADDGRGEGDPEDGQLHEDEWHDTFTLCGGGVGEDGQDGTDGADGADGVDGADGTDGEDGHSSLLEVVAPTAPLPAICTSQSRTVRWGLDDGDDGGTARDGQLQDGEVDGESLLCIPAAGAASVVALQWRHTTAGGVTEVPLDAIFVLDATIQDGGLPALLVNTDGGTRIFRCLVNDCSTGTFVDLGVSGFFGSLRVGPNSRLAAAWVTSSGVHFRACQDTACSSLTALATVMSGSSYHHAHLAYDGLGRPVLAASGASPQLRLCTASDCSTSVSGGSMPGAYSGVRIARGLDGALLVMYGEGTNHDLRLIRCPTLPCTASPITVDPGVFENGIGSHLFRGNLAVPEDGRPVLAYTDSPGDAVKMARCTTPACTSATTTVLHTCAGCAPYPDVTVGGSGKPLFLYQVFESPNRRLTLTSCLDDACSQRVSHAIDSSTSNYNGLAITVGYDGVPVVAVTDGSGSSALRPGNPWGAPYFARDS